MKEQLEKYVKHVKDNYEACKNEAQTKASLIEPLFSLLGWDRTNPKEWLMEYKADFGKGTTDKSTKPVDYGFAINRIFAFITEAKEVGVKLNKAGKAHPQQLGMYFNQIRTEQQSLCLGIYTNGIHWQFFTNLDDNGGVMDKEPFLSWDILADDPIPVDFLALLQKSQFQPQLIKTFAEVGRRKNLLVQELTKLLDPPTPDFIKMAVANIESAKMTEKVVEQWKPILINAIQEWAKIKVMGMVQSGSDTKQVKEPGNSEDEPNRINQRGKKTCPECQKLLGVRTQQCECGHAFPINHKKESTDQPDETEPSESQP